MEIPAQFKILSDAASVYSRYLMSSHGGEGISYLLSRGIDPIMVKTFNLGMSPPKNMFTKMMCSEKHEYKNKIENLQEIGLVYHSEETGAKEFFSNNIIIPTMDINGNTISLTGKPLYKTKRKYLNMSGLKTDCLFGMHNIKNRFRYPKFKGFPENYVILCEGQFDTIITTQKGYFCLGVLGANSFKENMVEYLDLFDTIIIAFDNDKAGKKATELVAAHLKYVFIHKRILSLDLDEEYNDLNEFWLRNKESALHESLCEINVKPKKLEKQKNISRMKTISSSFDILKGISAFSRGNGKQISWNHTGNLCMCNCPFPDHSDYHSSFTVYKETNSFYCFGCGRGGDFSKFLHYFKQIGKGS